MVMADQKGKEPLLHYFLGQALVALQVFSHVANGYASPVIFN